ncbi:MAG TPA: beta-ketoacyl-ACP synthase [Acetobacteraceae bacterium]|jgi:3-oxoacyl-[acyl-carrier-protein] synthase II|nr:beta-ketoacyl-ACP synthase [Acetobacteraceae bacterium]
MANSRDAMITGIGLVSCLGDGAEAHWTALNNFHPVVDETTFAPFLVHPVVPLELDRQIPKRGDQRQMEAWQRIGTYAAGLALDFAGVKGNAELLSRMDMIVAAGGGERDYAVDAAIMSAIPSSADPGTYLNEHLLSDLRPTLFLAQLSNLLAGNISIVHGVVGSSRTFMGEEAAGADAVRIACARIAAGQGDLFLVGGSYNAQRPDILVHYEMASLLWKLPFAGVWERQAKGGGMVLGSLGCFLVIESREHAAARGATALAHIAAIATDRCRRRPGEATANAERQFAAIRHHLAPEHSAVISGATGVAAATQEEAAFLRGVGLPIRASATAVGHSIEPSFPANIALASMALARRRMFAPLEAAEHPMASELRQVLVTSWGHWRGEAMAVIEGV